MPLEELVQPGVVESARRLRAARHNFVLAESKALACLFRLKVRQALVVRVHEGCGERITKLRNSQKRGNARVPMLHGQRFTRPRLRQDSLVRWIKLAQVVELRPQTHRPDKSLPKLCLVASSAVGVRARPSDNAAYVSHIALVRAAILSAMGERDRFNPVGWWRRHIPA